MTQLFQVSAHVALAGRPGPYSRRPIFAFNDESWVAQALCAQIDYEIFFPENGGSTREAKKVCMGCDVRRQCLEYALAHDERFGVWGGLSERQRRKLKRAS